MDSYNEADLRLQLLRRIHGVGAHMPFEEAVKDFPMDRINDRFPNGPYSPWALLEHIRMGQLDMLDYMKNPNYKDLRWPEDYWPDWDRPATPADWNATLESFYRDRRELEAMIQDPNRNMFSTAPSNSEHTVLRELLQIAVHNAFHTGEFAIMRQVMGTWHAGH